MGNNLLNQIIVHIIFILKSDYIQQILNFGSMSNTSKSASCHFEIQFIGPGSQW